MTAAAPSGVVPLGYLTPVEYAARCSHTHHPVAYEIN
jgi:hypothetical protein